MCQQMCRRKDYGEWEYTWRINISETKGVSHIKPFTAYAHSEQKEFFKGTESQWQILTLHADYDEPRRLTFTCDRIID